MNGFPYLIDAAVVVMEWGLAGVDGDGDGAGGGQSLLKRLLVAGRTHVDESFVLGRRLQRVVTTRIVLEGDGVRRIRNQGRGLWSKSINRVQKYIKSVI